MVNKAVVGVIGVILIVTLGVGALVGLQGGGGSPADDGNSGNGDGNGGIEATPTPTPNGSMDNVSVSTPGSSERTPIPAREFNVAEIERNVSDQLNDWRGTENLSELQRSATTAERLNAMAREYSATMADEGNASHVIDGIDTTQRFRNDDLFDACQYRTEEGFIAQPGEAGGRNVQFEYVTSTVAGGTYATENGTRFNANNHDVATAIVENIEAEAGDPKGMLKPGITRMGVGVEITRTGGVYATVHLCGG